MRNKILEIINSVIPKEFSSHVCQLMKCCIYCAYVDSSDESCEPISKFGGLPLLPASMAWPEIEGRQLFFVAQFQLERLIEVSPSINIKDRGILTFFYDDNNGECGINHRVYLFPEKEMSTLVEKAPRDPSPHVFPQKGYHFKEGVSIPNSLEDIEHPLYDTIESWYIDVVGAFCCVCNDHFGYYDQFGGYTAGNYEPIPNDDNELVVQFNSVSDTYHYLIPVVEGCLDLEKITVYYTTS